MAAPNPNAPNPNAPNPPSGAGATGPIPIGRPAPNAQPMVINVNLNPSNKEVASAIKKGKYQPVPSTIYSTSPLVDASQLPANARISDVPTAGEVAPNSPNATFWVPYQPTPSLLHLPQPGVNNGQTTE